MSRRASFLPSSRRRNGAGVVLLLLAGAGFLFFAPWKAHEPSERLRDIASEPSAWTVRNDELIQGKRDDVEFSILASPIRGGKERVLYSLSLENRSVNLVVAETELRLISRELPPPPAIPPTVSVLSGSIGSGTGVIPLSNVRNLGKFLPPVKADAIPPDAKKISVPVRFSGAEDTLYQRDAPSCIV